MVALSTDTVDDAHLPREQRRFPFLAANDDERDAVRADIDRVLRDVNDLLYHRAVRLLPWADRDAIEEGVQYCRLRLWSYALARYDRNRNARVSTYVYRTATRSLLSFQRKYIRERHQRRARPLSGVRTPAPDSHADRLAERLFVGLAENPGRLLSPRAAQTLRLCLTRPSLKDAARELGIAPARMSLRANELRKEIGDIVRREYV